MASTQITGRQIADGSIERSDINISAAGKALIRKIIETPSTGLTISSYTGADSGTGDVTLAIDTNTIATRAWVQAQGYLTSNDGYISEVALHGNDLQFTGVGNAFSGNVDLSSLIPTEVDTLATVTSRGAVTSTPVTFNSNVTLGNNADLIFQDLAGVFPTTGKGFDWTLNNDGARIYAIQPSSDSIDFVFQLRDNATTNDRFVFWVQEWQGVAYDKYPLIIRGGTEFDLVDSGLFIRGTQVITNGRNLQNVSGNISMFTNDSGYITVAALNGYATQTYVNTNIQSGLDSLAAVAHSGAYADLSGTPAYAITATQWTVNHTLADGTRYLINDVVYDNGNIYKALFENESIPTSNTTYWQLVGPGSRINLDGRDIPNIQFTQLSSVPTTIAGYGITNAYTDAQIQNFFNGANAITGYNKSNWDTAYSWGNHATAGYQPASTAINTSNIGSQSVNYANSAGSSTTTLRGIVEDTRGGQRTPTDYDDYRVSWEFTNQIPGLNSGGSTWWSAMTIQGWHDGYAAWQIIGPASSAVEDFYLRSGNNAFWNTSRRIWHNGDFTSTNVSNWNTAYSWGNHTTAGYATQAWVQSQGYLTSVSDVWVNTSGDTMTGTLSFAQPVGLSFANGQYIKDNDNGGLIISSGAAVGITGTSIAVTGAATFSSSVKLASGVLSLDGVTSYWGNSIKYESGQIRIYQSGDIHAAFGGSVNYLYKNTKISPNLLLTAGGYSNTDGITIWGTQNAGYGGDGFVGRNLYYNGTNYVYATTDANNLWGTVAGVRVLGNSSNALEFVARPATNSGLNVIASDIASYTHMVISYSGNVGINTSTPQVKLDVNGALGIVGSNFLYFGHTTGNIGAWTTRQYSSGSTHKFNAQEFIFNNEGYGSVEFMKLNASGFSLRGKNTIDSTDSWLRLNQAGDYGSGVYTPYALRNDGAFDNYGGIYGYNTIRARKSQTANNYTTAALWTESYDNTTTGIAFHISGNVGKFLEMRTDGILYWEDRQVWTSGNLTNLNQLSNGPGYITGYTETDTLSSVTARGNTTTGSITVLGGQGAAETTDGFGLEIMGNYTNGQYNHRLAKFDKSGGVPLYVQLTLGAANVWSNSARFGTYTGNGYEFEVYGAAKVNGDFVSTGQINASGGNSSNWNTAFGWGNHASAGYATTSYVTTQINNLIAGAPGALDTLDELAAALGDDSNFATTVTNSIAGKVSKSGDTMTGSLRFNEGSGFGRVAYLDNYHGMILRGIPSDAAGNVTVGDYTSLIQHSGDFRFYRTNGSINELYFQVNASAAYWRGNTIWHSGNDGAGSGLDADLLDGFQASQSGGGNVVLTTASNGYLYVNNWIHPANGTGLFYDSGPHFYENGGQMYSSHALRVNANILISDGTDNNSFTKGSNFLNLRDPWNNLHMRIDSGGGMYFDAGHFLLRRPDGGTNWLYLDGSNYNVYIEQHNYARVTFRYNTDRYAQSWYNSTTGAYWWVTTDAGQLGLHRNGDGDKFYFSNGGDFYSTTNGWLSTALAGKSNTGHTHDDRYYTESESDARYQPIENQRLSTSNSPTFAGLTINGGVNAYAGVIRLNEIRFTDTAGSTASDPYTMRWVSESSVRGAGLSWLEFQLNDDSNEEIRIYGNSCVGYGCGTYSENLYHRFRADGYAWHAGDLEVGGTITENSSIRYKENVRPLESVSDKIAKVAPVRYNKKGGSTEEIGFIAEDMATIYPEVVKFDAEGRPDGINYTRLSAILIKAVQELTNKVNKLEKKA